MPIRQHIVLTPILAVLTTSIVLSSEPPAAAQVAQEIDRRLHEHWTAHDVTPAPPADNATFLRRMTLDLAGRIPTAEEVSRFLGDPTPDKHRQTARRLVEGPEFPLHFAHVLDTMIQQRYAGNGKFIGYLRGRLRDRTAWDALFRELMLGPWDTDERKPANRFLDKRARNMDAMTVDTARIFFGVNISCAKCHDHPLVPDWTQRHYYGMAAFFVRTTGGKGKVGEKKAGEIKFPGPDGKEITAKAMFLSGQLAGPTEPGDALSSKDSPGKTTVSRREQLVQTALHDRVYLSRSIVNRMWNYFFGHGLVNPVDQMHSGNPPEVPGLLEWLAADFADSGYDLHRLVEALVSTRLYRLSSRTGDGEDPPDASLFAAARLRPLTPRQYGLSLLLATGTVRLDSTAEPERLAEQHQQADKQAEDFLGALDRLAAGEQTSTDEALYMSNHERIQNLVAPGEDNLAARLSAQSDAEDIVDTVTRAVFGRPVRDAERDALLAWFRQQPDRKAACEQLVWALVTSAEFRFNH